MLAESTSWNDPLILVTSALFAATFLLARATWRLAHTSAQEVRAQSRPLLLPVRGVDVPVTISEDTDPHSGRFRNVHVRLRNAGLGPALGVRMALQRSSGFGHEAITTVSPPAPISVAVAMAAGDEFEAVLPLFDRDDAKLSTPSSSRSIWTSPACDTPPAST